MEDSSYLWTPEKVKCSTVNCTHNTVIFASNTDGLLGPIPGSCLAPQDPLITFASPQTSEKFCCLEL